MKKEQKNFIKLSSLAFIIFTLVDYIWLGFLAKDLYKYYLQSFISDNPKILAAILFYFLFSIILTYFVIKPGLEKPIKRTSKDALFFGFACYMTFELTSYSILDSWPLSIVFIDIIWGSFLSLITTYLTIRVYKKYFT